MNSPFPHGTAPLSSRPIHWFDTPTPVAPPPKPAMNRLKIAGFSAGVACLVAIGAVGAVLIVGGPSSPVAHEAAPSVEEPAAQAAVLTPKVSIPAKIPAENELPAPPSGADARVVQDAPAATETAAIQPPQPASEPDQVATSSATPVSNVPDETTPAPPAASSAAGSDVQVAETPQQELALAERMARQSPDFALPATDMPAPAAPVAPAAPAQPEKLAAAAPAAASSASELRDATVTSAVKMHSGPDNKAGVVTVVPAKADIKASLRCPVWCEVEYRGQHGYIFKNFVK